MALRRPKRPANEAAKKSMTNGKYVKRDRQDFFNVVLVFELNDNATKFRSKIFDSIENSLVFTVHQVKVGNII